MAMPSKTTTRQDRYTSQPSGSSQKPPIASKTVASILKPPEKPESSSKKNMFKKRGNYFSFKVQSRVLKHAIDGLADPEVNPSGLGLMQVCQDGFEMSVHQCTRPGTKNEHLFGLLSLKASGLTEFRCRGLLVRMIRLADIVDFLETKANDAEFVKVFNVEGFDYLTLQFKKRMFLGVPRRISHDIPFSEAAAITKFPAFSYGFKVDIPSDKLQPLVNGILAEIPRRRPPFVTLTVDTNVSITIGKDFHVTPDQDKTHVWLIFPYYESLRKTQTLADEVTLMLVTNPANSVALRYDLKELGDFIYLKFATQFFMTKGLPTIGAFSPLSR